MWRMRDIYIYYNIVYKYSLPFIGRELLPLRIVARFQPNWFLQLFPCGTKFHTVFFKITGHVAEGETSDQVKPDRGASIEWTRGPPNHDQGTCLKCRHYNGDDAIWRGASRSSDRDPMATNRCVFITVITRIIRTVHRDRTATTCSKRSTIDRSIVIVNRFDRTVTPKIPIKRYVLPNSKAFELEINKLICLDTSPLIFLDLIVF